MSADQTLNRLLWELELNAWPALRQTLLDGWVCRFSEGYTGRANSVMPLAGGALLPEVKIRIAEGLYRSADLPPMFCLHTAYEPPDLDAFLERRGYRKRVFHDCTSVSIQTAELRGRYDHGSPELEVTSVPSEPWFDALATCAGCAPSSVAIFRRMLQRMVPEAGYALLHDNRGRALSCGLGVLERRWLGLFTVGTAPEARRRGHAQRLVEGLLSWGQARGANGAYLQVISNNHSGNALYRGFRFSEVGTYWYRMQD
ncbi:MAG: GNAT family N-acetyltransferase [Lentisphaerae bacterium]|jgi:N-acetylglutamate synthase|nr:GNAT family N-acetyltransferase [Lentisphaerota bacterium]MBT4822728.1 GNAT family N-acetyltransferase [Lentisphaerota bacterium]MBT5609516.1 GNAT family N-acetyltransferase [Lentisphaerota bacterium]MBT7058486.1 GNAT family N-acetyltransferase [Lentisphaerota bacterium]MBT7845936.1 GNAT family N-acetyltransferase [Lentisphaerota bacterium]